ncbi:glycoside hydrolase family 14 protein [Medicago truncatula]|uniref:Beta-amylase n=2 Tax=Medicago truncatula TaxID=3880 RepID=G7IT30_MEDTR|nr:glycoside hydrolase family 14 protein [Medicago truncatula]
MKTNIIIMYEWIFNLAGKLPYELHHDLSPQRRRCGSPLFVTLPMKYVGLEGNIWRPKAMMLSLKALAVAGVEGVVVEIWWGGVELVMMACVSSKWH